jgi:rhodanese-related sulfurtransferase
MMKLKPLKPLLLALLIVFMVPAVLSGCLSREAEVASSENTSIIEDVNLKEAYAIIVDNLSNPDFVIIDVRTPGEYASGHIEDAINIDFYADDFDEQLNKLDRDKIYLIYCQGGNRSGKTLDKMKALRFQEVYNMLGGIANWERTGLPTVQ